MGYVGPTRRKFSGEPSTGGEVLFRVLTLAALIFGIWLFGKQT